MTRLRLLLPLLATALLVSACGSADDGEESESEGTRVVQTERGEVEVPADPERVVTVGWTLPPSMIDLGITPLAIDEGYFEAEVAAERSLPKRYVEALADAERIGNYQSLSLEKVAAAKPDLIVTDAVGLDDKTLDQLADIAPLAHVSSEGGWLKSQERVAEVVNRVDEFEELKTEFETKADDIREEHAEVLEDTTWAVISGAPDEQWFVEGGATPASSLLDAVGSTFSEAVDPEGYSDDPRSYETISDIEDADVILYPAAPDGGPNDLTAPMLDHRLFTDLPAAQAGNVFGFRHTAVTSTGWAADGLDEIDEILGEVKAQ